MKILICFLSRTLYTKIIAYQIKELLDKENNIELSEISERKKYHFLKITLSPFGKNNYFFSSVIGSPKLYLDTYRKKRPEIEKISVNFQNYDIIFICSPIWYGRLPPAMNTFIANYLSNVKKKKIFIIVTSGRGKSVENYIKVLKNEIEKHGLIVNRELHKTNGTYLTKKDKKMIVDFIKL